MIAVCLQDNSSGPTMYTPPDDVDLEMERREDKAKDSSL